MERNFGGNIIELLTKDIGKNRYGLILYLTMDFTARI